MLVTSQTRAELAPMRERLQVDGEDVVENGAYGLPRAELYRCLKNASEHTAVPVQAFTEMTTRQLATLTGLPLAVAELAAQREHSEPFLILDESGAARLLSALEQQGLRWTRGGRFYHVFERGGKAEAVQRILSRGIYRRSLGLGDAPNDVEFLRLMDEAVIVASPRAADMHRQLPHAAITPEPGPQGWARAVSRWLSGALAASSPQ